MTRLTRSITRPRPDRFHAFTALEALVMLVTLFILTMLGIGLWKKHDREEKIDMPPPANTIGLIKSESPKADKNPSAKETNVPSTPGKPGPAKPTPDIPDQDPPIEKSGQKKSPD